MGQNSELIEVIKAAIWRERERIDRAEKEIIKLRLELLELGVDPEVIESH